MFLKNRKLIVNLKFLKSKIHQKLPFNERDSFILEFLAAVHVSDIQNSGDIFNGYVILQRLGTPVLQLQQIVLKSFKYKFKLSKNEGSRHWGGWLAYFHRSLDTNQTSLKQCTKLDLVSIPKKCTKLDLVSIPRKCTKLDLVSISKKCTRLDQIPPPIHINIRLIALLKYQ
jgi:hypothetical protein